jgi:hypothetical protein
VRGDPLADISLMKNVSFIMKDGAIYKKDGKVVMPIGPIPVDDGPANGLNAGDLPDEP